MSRCSPILLSVLLVAPLAACAATGPGAGPGAQDPDPKALPVGAVLDSASLAAALREAAPPAALPVPSAFRIYFGAEGTPDSIRPVFRRLPGEYAGAVAALIRPHLRVQPPRKEGWSYTVRAEPGPTPRLEAPDFTEQPPVLLNREEVAAAVARFIQGVRSMHPDYPKGTRTATLKMLVRENGVPDPESVTLVRRSWDQQVDREAVRLAERLRFRPAALDGYPVDVYVTMPITFQF